MTRIVRIKTQNLGEPSFLGNLTSISTISCKSQKATSAQVKCSLPSSLQNVKSIENIELNVLSNNIIIQVSANYIAPGDLLPQVQKQKIISLDARYSFSTDSGSDLSSSSIYNHNIMEASIPPNSCFDLQMKEDITTLRIPFLVADISGTIDANIITSEYSQLTPCV